MKSLFSKFNITNFLSKFHISTKQIIPKIESIQNQLGNKAEQLLQQQNLNLRTECQKAVVTKGFSSSMKQKLIINSIPYKYKYLSPSQQTFKLGSKSKFVVQWSNQSQFNPFQSNQNNKKLQNSTSGSYQSSGSHQSISSQTVGKKFTENDQQIRSKNHQKEFDDSANNQIFKICLTGGPCGGKTTALTQMKTQCKQKGYDVYIVPEVATLSMMGGVVLNLPEEKKDILFNTQIQITKLQMSLEDFFYKIAKAHNKPAIIFCDRGSMDSTAYIKDEYREEFFSRLQWNPVELRDQRYDGVIHMVTAADGAEEFYSNSTNQTRYETVEQAIYVDQRLQAAWMGHPHHYIINNTQGESFDDKLNQVLVSVGDIIGEPIAAERMKKFVLERFDIPNDLKFEKFKIRDIFLHGSNEDQLMFIRQAEQNEQYNFIEEKAKLTTKGDKQIMISRQKRPITHKEFLFLAGLKDPKLQEVQYEKYYFLWDKIPYRVAVFDCQKNGQTIVMRVGLQNAKEKIKFPPFIKVKKDVTKDRAYTLFHFEFANQQDYITDKYD